MELQEAIRNSSYFLKLFRMTIEFKLFFDFFIQMRKVNYETFLIFILFKIFFE